MVYLEPDPATVHLVDQITAGSDRAYAVRADLRLMTPAVVFDQLRRRQLFDTRQRAAVLALGGQWLSVSPRSLIAAARARLAPGSIILLTHAAAPPTGDIAGRHRHFQAVACYRRAGARPTSRTAAERAQLLVGITAPGSDQVRVIVSTDNRHPHSGDGVVHRSRALCGAGAIS